MTKKLCTYCGGTGLIDYDDSHGEPRNAPCYHESERSPTDFESSTRQQSKAATEGKSIGDRSEPELLR